MKILICCSGHFGGTDFLLKRCYEWMVSHSVDAEMVSPETENLKKKSSSYDFVLLPSSQMHQLIKLKRHGYKFNRILIWIMGCGSFNDSYYNPDRAKGTEKIIYNFFDFLARKSVTRLYKNNSICFTDEVGMEATLLQTGLSFKQNKENLIIPIAIQIPDKNYEFVKGKNEPIHLCWIGRVSKDFKSIPIQHLINDMDELISTGKYQMDLTIVGMGDAWEDIKNLASKKKFDINFRESVDYDRIGEFLYDNADILVAMGTSVLDGAKNGCPSVVITPVKPSNKEEVDYRWIFESKGYSLGEYPDIKSGPDQVKKSLKTICDEYQENDGFNTKSYEYACEFDENKVFSKLLNRPLPHTMTFISWLHIYIFSFIVHFKKFVKQLSKKGFRREQMK